MARDGARTGSGTDRTHRWSGDVRCKAETGPESKKGDTESRKNLSFKSEGYEKEGALELFQNEYRFRLEKGKGQSEKTGNGEDQG